MIEEELDDKIAEIEKRHFEVQNSWHTELELNQLAIRDVAWLLDQLKLHRSALEDAAQDNDAQMCPVCKHTCQEVPPPCGYYGPEQYLRGARNGKS